MKKKKRKVLSKKEKLIIICVAIVAFLVILAIALTIGKSNDTSDNKVDITDLKHELSSVEEIVTYLESDFISMENSKENGYDLDIYVSFKNHLYDGENSQELYFTNFYEKIAMVTYFKSFRLIDSGKGITIEVKCNSNGISEVRINGELNYFRKEDSKKSAEKAIDVETLDLEINASVLQDLINHKWNAKEVDLGSKEGSFYKYDIYFDEGYEIRNIQGKVFNIVFTSGYNGKVVGDYKVGENLERVENDLGNGYNQDGNLGYKTKDFYVWFSKDEISIYPIYKTDYTEFEELVKEYESNPDANNFMYKITDIWKDYNLYTSNQNYVEICYANKGVKFEYSVANPVGIQIYGNYTGDLKDELENYSKVYYKLNKNLTGETEVQRLDNKAFYDDNEIEEDPIHYSSKFMLMLSFDGEKYTDVKIQSLDGQYPNNEFDETISIYTYVWADDYHLIYSVRGEGIYMYDAQNRTTSQLLSGTGEYNITNYDRDTNIIEYDGIQAFVK